MLREQFIELLGDLRQAGLTIQGHIGDPDNRVVYYIYDGVSIGGRGSDHFSVTYHVFRSGQFDEGGKIIVPYYEVNSIADLKKYIEGQLQRMFSELTSDSDM